MARITKSIFINAPVEKVFAYSDDPLHAPEYWPSLVEVNNVEPLPNGGYRYRWVYKMAGIRLEGSSEEIEHQVNHKFVTRSKGGIDSLITWTFQPEGNGTRLTTETEYTIPLPVLGKLAEAFIVKTNDREGETLLANLKDRVEALEAVK